MPRVNVSLNDAEVPKAIPKGDYKVECVKCEAKDASSSRTQYLEFQFEIIEDGEFRGKKVYDRATFFLDPSTDDYENKDKNMRGFLKEKLEALGVKWDAQGFDTEECVGKKAIAAVTVGEWNGRETNNITRLHPIKRRA